MSGLKINSLNAVSTVRSIPKGSRNNLQRISPLKNLNGGSFSEDPITYVIHGGMSFKEKAYYNLTGKFSKSVLARMEEANRIGVKIGEDDLVIKVGDHLSGDPGYGFIRGEDFLAAGHTEVTSHGGESTSFTDSIIESVMNTL